MRIMYLFPAVFLVLAACNKTASQQSSVPVPIQTGSRIMVLEETILRVMPNDERVAPHPLGAEAPIKNFVGQLNRGKGGRVLKQEAGWAQVVLDDDAEGWLRSNAAMSMEGVVEATVVRATPVYPLQGGQTASAMAMPGVLLFVVERSGKQSRVQIEGQGFAWIDTQALEQSPEEVAMAHLILEARTSARLGDIVGATDALDAATAEHAGSNLLPTLLEQVHAARKNSAPRAPMAEEHLAPPE